MHQLIEPGSALVVAEQRLAQPQAILKVHACAVGRVYGSDGPLPTDADRLNATGRFGDADTGARCGRRLGRHSAGTCARGRILAAGQVVFRDSRHYLGQGLPLRGSAARAGAGPGLGQLSQGPVGVVVQPAQAGAQEGIHLLAACGQVGMSVGVLAGLRPEGPGRMRVLAGHDQDHLIMACHLSTASTAATRDAR
jgi:hypothetical protein